MNADHPNDYSYLDRIRIQEGADPCRNTLTELFRKDTRRAVTLLNDRRLLFPCLYILHESIPRFRVQRYLSRRNLIALRLIDQFKGAADSKTDYLSSRQDSVYPVLKWILETGSAEGIPEDDYEEILDVTASVLINLYQNPDILPPVVDLIFERNRNERHIHDLVWALFRFHDPRILKLIAQRLLSADPNDVELAAELLNIDKTNAPSENSGKGKRYEGYLHWLEENQPYLYFTEESFQYTSKPMFCAVDLARKYLQKGASSYDKQPLSSADDEEMENMEVFKQLSGQEQKILADYSQRMCAENMSAWKEWLHKPVEEQIRSAKARGEGDE